MGIKAQNKAGEYFRNNVWWWRQLWVFISIVAESNKIFSESDYTKGNFNNGDEISAQKTKKLVEALELNLVNSNAKLHSRLIARLVRSAKKNNKNLTAQDKNYDWNEAYPFTITNLKEFIKFAKNSGGFRIC